MPSHMPQGTPSQAAIDRRLRKIAQNSGGDYDDATDNAMIKGKADSVMNKNQPTTSQIFNRLKHLRTINPSQGRISLPTAGFSRKSRSVASGFNPSTASRARRGRFGPNEGRF